MNVERINALADLIEAQPHSEEKGFHMNHVVHGCGTPSCIAGWAEWENEGRPASLTFSGEGFLENAAKYLGIGEYDYDNKKLKATKLFYPGKTYYYSTPAHAAKVLRHLAATGEVDWSITA